MRTKYSFYNFLVSLITSVALPIFGFIKVRMFIDLYGSDLNGLQLTIMNVITFLNVFELSYSLINTLCPLILGLFTLWFEKAYPAKIARG